MTTSVTTKQPTLKKQKWKRPKPCWCSGYWFPHRVQSGACEHNPDKMAVLRILAPRLGLTSEEFLDLQAEIAFTSPGVISRECPF